MWRRARAGRVGGFSDGDFSWTVPTARAGGKKIPLAATILHPLNRSASRVASFADVRVGASSRRRLARRGLQAATLARPTRHLLNFADAKDALDQPQDARRN
jgi:hypothetical protein